MTTDQYPPFRSDTVGHETGGTLVLPPPTAPAGSAAPVSAALTRPAVVMNANAAPEVTVWSDVGATMPALTGMAIGLLAGGAVLLAGGAVLVMLAARRAGERR